MELEFGQLELRYERLWLTRPGRERQLLSSLASCGQQVPVVVVAEVSSGQHIVIDGYKRVRCLKKLARDTVQATALELGEAEALVLSRQMSAVESDTAVEQGWLLEEMERRFGMSQEELARRFDRNVSWVSRRLGLVREMPDEVQERVRRGEIVAHAAVKYLLPLARAKQSDCEGLVAALGARRLSSREVGLLYRAWRERTARTRERLIAEPLVCLKAIKKIETRPQAEPGPGQKLLNDNMEALGAIARRAHRQLREGAAMRLLPGEREEIGRCWAQSRVEVERLAVRMSREVESAGRGTENRDPATEAGGARRAGDRANDAPVEEGGAAGRPPDGTGRATGGRLIRTRSGTGRGSSHVAHAGPLGRGTSPYAELRARS